MNIGNASVVAVTPAWKILLRAACGVSAGLTALCAAMYFRKKKKAGK